MALEESTIDVDGADTQISFKVKTSSDGMHSITIAENATVLDLKTKLSGEKYENLPVNRMRLIYSGRVMKDPESLSTYKIKAGNTVHMVKSAASNAVQNPAGSGTGLPARPAVPTNMATGTANNPLAGLTGARYAGHMGLPGMDMFGADAGMGAPPSEDQVASMLDDPNLQQTMNEALQNPAMVDMMINSIPGLRNNPQARQMFNDPEFRRMLTNPDSIRQAASMRRLMQGGGAGGGFPAPGVTDTTPGGTAGTTPNQNQAAFNPFAMQGFGQPGAAGVGNPFGNLFGAPSQTPAQTPPAPGSAGQQTPGPADPNAAAANPFASLFQGGGAGGQNPFAQGMPNFTPEQMQQAMQMMQQGGLSNMFGGGAANPPAPADTRPPEEIYADQLRQLNDMGFFDFDRNVAALRRSGGSVQGAIEQLLT
ncbi:related to deubiquitination-protection protein dph1 [Rhynchosporium secalis]|uniref:Related to deubiquitination-protection protein dph1 n=1 Tax=Rhynchosporium secalis TaxID=38038 RepID=A0A1E1ME93_RHYSE|nr:related to deubiquitination-protection protein dph1 [Rhynchosporium secalis]